MCKIKNNVLLVIVTFGLFTATPMLAQEMPSQNNSAMMAPTAVTFTEGFEGTTFPPTGWSQLDPDGAANTTAVWERVSLGTNAYEGSWVAGIRRDNDWLITPQVNLVNGSIISFWASLNNNNDGVYVRFKYSTDLVNWIDVGNPETIPGSVIGWTYHSNTFTTNVGPAYIAFAGSGNVNGWLYLDYVQYEEPGIDITFDKTGVDAGFTGTILTVTTTAGTINYSNTDIWPITVNVAVNSNVTYAYQSPLTNGGTRNVWNTTTGTLGQTLQGNTFTATVAGSVIGNYLTQYYLTVTSPYGTPGGEGWYDSGVNAQATVNPLTVSGGAGIQHLFTNWSGDATGTSSPSNNILMDGPKTATAVWKTQYYLTVNSPYGLPTSGAGWYDSGVNATASITSGTEAGGAGTQYVFTNWSVDATGTGLTSNNILMNGPKTATAVWKTQYYLTVTSTYGTPGGEGWKDANSNAQATVAPLTVAGAAGVQYVFDGWSGDASGSGSPSNNILMDAPKTATATWKTQYYLTVNSPYGLPTSGAGWYDSGVNATASITNGTESGAPGVQYIFTNWSVDATGTGLTSDNILMDGPKTATAVWKTQYYLTVNSPYGLPTSGAGWYDSGVNATASITNGTESGAPGVQYIFTNWSVDATGTGLTSDNILMDGPKTATAVWKTQYYLTVNSPYGLPTSGAGWYDSGVNATASITNGTEAGAPGVQYVFTNWSVDATGTGLTSDNILMDGPKTATAVWKTQYELTMSANFGTTTPAIGTHWYDAGTVLTISADASTYTWIGWTGTGTGSYTGTDNPATNAVTMNGPITQYAEWESSELYTLTLITNPLDLTLPTGGGDYAPGVTAYISTTNPVDSSPYFWFFAGWTTDDMDEIDDPWSVSTMVFMDMTKTVTANYQSMIKRNCGRTIGFWGNKNGQAYLTLEDAIYFNTLPPYATFTGYPRQPAGSTPFNETDLAAFKNQLYGYLRNANSTNPGYMLAAQLLATMLSEKYFCLDMTDEVWVDDGDMVYEPGENWLVGDIITDAINTWVSGVNQNFYKNLLDDINNNRLWFVVPPPTPPTPRAIVNVNRSVMNGINTTTITPMVNVAPNPVKGNATIRYNVPTSGKVSLKLYNTMGRLVNVIHDGYLNAGTHTNSITTQNLAKGIYFLRFTDAENKLEVKLIVQ